MGGNAKMKCPLCNDSHFFDHTSDPAIPEGIFICSKCGNQMEKKQPKEIKAPLTPWNPPIYPEIPLKKLSLAETLAQGDYIKDTSLLAPCKITSALIGIKIKDIIFHFNRDTFQGFFRKV